jgi:hypothetical protein
MATSKKINASKLSLGPKKPVKKTPATGEKADAAASNIHDTPTNGQPGEKNVRFTLDIPESLHETLKMRVISKKKGSLKNYMIELCYADIKANP